MTTVVVRGGGTAGPQGTGWLHGTGAPSPTLGIEGDYYVDMSAAPSVYVFYGPKTNGAWGTGAPINSGSDPSVFNVRSYGAVGDGVTDDTAAIRAAVNAAVAYGQSNSQHYAEVYFPPATYLLSSAPIKGGSTHGNSVLPLPVIAPTAAKVTLRLHGLGEPSALPHWQQTVPQVSGTVLRATYQEVALDSTYGECSVLGGPTPQQGYGTGASTLFNNLMVVVDGIQIQTKASHTAGYISGFDFRGLAEVHVVNAGAFTDATPPTITFPTGAGWEFGLAMPFPANNAYSLVNTFSCEGFTYGAWLSEHCVVTQVACVYCYNGLTFIGSYESSGAVQHTCHVMYACIEACTNALLVTPNSRLLVDQLDVENISSKHVRDPDGTSVGYVGLGGIISSILVDTTKLKVEYIDRAPGTFNAPAMPSSGTSFRSTAWRDAAVSITGGTVTAIAVDGQTTGLTSGTVIVPTGRNITLTYSVAPTWTWMLL